MEPKVTQRKRIFLVNRNRRKLGGKCVPGQFTFPGTSFMFITLFFTKTAYRTGIAISGIRESSKAHDQNNTQKEPFIENQSSHDLELKEIWRLDDIQRTNVTLN